MTIIRIIVACALVLCVAGSAFAQAPAPVAQQPAPAAPEVPAPSGKALIYSGAAVFVGGVSMALYGFIRAGNGEFSRFGEATARSKPLGAAGIAAAFAGGTMMFLGTRALRYAPSVTVSRSGLAVEKMVTW
jgi:hypothetical protein